MSLLSVTVKKALFVGVQANQYNTYVTLKLQNVKSTTVTVKGPNPCWEQDFLFETNDVNSGLLIEVWSKGMLWDRALGYHWIPLPEVKYSNEEGTGQWVSLEAELVMRDGEVVGTKNPTGHSLLVDCRFELPFDPENTEGADLQRKLEMLNTIMDQEARAEQARRQLQYYGHSGYSEDSDYTSDLNYPVGQHANSSVSQFRSVAHQMHTPQRSLETSRENSYERDDLPARVSPAHPSYHNQHHLLPKTPSRQLPDEKYAYAASTTPETTRRYSENESEPLFYNSRPRNYKEYSRRRKNTWNESEKSGSWYESGYSASYSQEHDETVEVQDQSFAGDDAYYETPTDAAHKRVRGRRRSLERQATLYDDQYYADGSYYGESGQITQEAYHYDQTQPAYGTDYYPASTEYAYQDDRYGQEQEDRQWDSGGYYYREDDYSATIGDQYKNSVNDHRSSATLPQPPVDAYPPQEAVMKPSLEETPQYYPPSQPLGYDDPVVGSYPGSDPYSAPSSASRRRLLMQHKRHSGSRHNSAEEFNYQPSYYDEYPVVTSTAACASTSTTVTTSYPTVTRSSYQKPTLPQIPNQSAAERRSSVKPTDYAQDDSYASYYATGKDDYNEDYNYAYRSTDNLTPTQQEAVEEKADPTGRYARPNAARLAYQEQSDEYYYSCQEREYSEEVEDSYLDTQPIESNRKKLSRRENSPLLQQNTDSLESRDDELRDSFETAVSSISSSVHHRQKGYSDYSTAGETATTITTPADAVAKTTASGYQPTQTKPVDTYKPTTDGYRQTTHPDIYKPGIESYKPTTSIVAGYNHTTSVTNQTIRNRDQDISSTTPVASVSVTIPSSTPAVTNTVLSSYPASSSGARGYLRAQESLDSCAEEVANLNASAEYAKPDSPASVLADRYSAGTPVEPMPQRLENSLIEPYQPPTPKAPSVIMSPSPPQMQKQHSVDESRTGSPSVTGSGESQKSQKSKSVSFEDEDQQMDQPPKQPVVERRKMTAKERWHYAYNKIIMQLNVSTGRVYRPYRYRYTFSLKMASG